eukprot:Amastigsp_a509716_29.p3 type:complete len:174 gc:universal Amastigsp_a509716_29:966-445(-)
MFAAVNARRLTVFESPRPSARAAPSRLGGNCISLRMASAFVWHENAKVTIGSASSTVPSETRANTSGSVSSSCERGASAALIATMSTTMSVRASERNENLARTVIRRANASGAIVRAVTSGTTTRRDANTEFSDVATAARGMSMSPSTMRYAAHAPKLLPIVHTATSTAPNLR